MEVLLRDSNPGLSHYPQPWFLCRPPLPRTTGRRAWPLLWRNAPQSGRISNRWSPALICLSVHCVHLFFSSLPGLGRLIDWAFNVKYMKMHTVWVWAMLKITISWESILSVVLNAVKCIYVTIFNFRVVLEENWPIMLEGDDIYESLGTLQVYLIFIYYFVQAFMNYFCRSYSLIWKF